MIIITNNPMIKEKHSERNIVYKEIGYIEVLKECRDYIHKGYNLLSHPLYGSVKPNETPYRTIIIQNDNKLDINSVNLIEESINTSSKFQNDKQTPNWNQSILEDFQVIDLDIFTNTINRVF